jgi:hypothetical protein
MSLSYIFTKFKEAGEKINHGKFCYKVSKAIDDNVYQLTIYRRGIWDSYSLDSVHFFSYNKMLKYLQENIEDENKINELIASKDNQDNQK